MVIDEIKDKVASALAKNGRVEVLGYRHGSGEVEDLVLLPGEQVHYYRLLQESRQQLRQDAHGASEEVRALVLTSFDTSLQKYAAVGEAPEVLKDGWQRFQSAVGPFYLVPEGVVLLHCRRLNGVRDQSSEAVSDKARARATLMAKLPIGSYVGRVNLYPGKFEDIR